MLSDIRRDHQARKTSKYISSIQIDKLHAPETTFKYVVLCVTAPNITRLFKKHSGFCTQTVIMFSALRKIRSFAGITRLHTNYSKNNRIYSTSGRPATSYKAAILEEFNKPLIVSNVKNDSPLGSEMVFIFRHKLRK